MIKKYIIVFSTAIFYIQQAFALNINEQLSKQMPKYTASFKIPAHSSYAPLFVIRFYQAFGDGSYHGWQSNVHLPTVTINGNPESLWDFFSYSNEGYLFGQVGLGYDQYAQYYGLSIPFADQEATLTITGTFQQVAYMSVVIYTSNNDILMQEELLDRQMSVVNDDLNPYILHNPSVFAYTEEMTSPLKLSTTHFFIDKKKLSVLHHLFVNQSTGKIDVYRLDKEESQQYPTDDLAPDGCSRDYLFAQKDIAQQMIILRVKVPKTFIEDNHPDTLFGDYQTRYFSVGSHRNDITEKSLLDFWTVNARMLKDHEDDEGYAYVFFAPEAYVRKLAAQQAVPPAQPPVIEWGQYKGYLLGDPSYAIIMRYRDPNPTWQGNPENGKCYATPEELKPATKEELGEYLPEIYGDTFAHFQAGHIGIVNKNASWPG
jgi:hypothetical protein